MPRFFFHFIEPGAHSLDDEGLELASANEAYLQACVTARALWPELLEQRIDPTRCAFEITDAQHQLLFRVSLTEPLEQCRTPAVPAASPTSLLAAIARSHERAKSAHANLNSCLTDTRKSLAELSDTLRQIDAYARAKPAFP